MSDNQNINTQQAAEQPQPAKETNNQAYTNQLPLIDDNGGKPRKLMVFIGIFLTLFIIISGVIIYRYFINAINVSNPDLNNQPPVAEVQTEENQEEQQNANNNSTKVNPQEGDFSGIVTSDQSGITQSGQVAGEKTKGGLPVTSTQTENQTNEGFKTETTTQPKTSNDESGFKSGTTTYWKPNNYNYGDIKTSKYTVIYGDTLWEIAEGFYGNGRKWVSIATANTVKYLKNGNPLIIPGQILNLP